MILPAVIHSASIHKVSVYRCVSSPGPSNTLSIECAPNGMKHRRSPQRQQRTQPQPHPIIITTNYEIIATTTTKTN